MNQLNPKNIPILKPVEKITVELSGEQYLGEQNSLKNRNAVTSSGLALNTYLIDVISGRLAILETNSLCAKATFLNPRFKKIGFGQATNADTAMRLVVNEFSAISSSKYRDNIETTEIETNEAAETDDIWAYFDNKVE